LGGTGGAAVCGDEKIDFSACELLNLLNELLIASARAIIERDSATLDVTKFKEPLPEGAGTSVRLRVKHSDVGNVRCLLRLGGDRRGEETT
jgi:hypothetical protein